MLSSLGIGGPRANNTRRSGAVAISSICTYLLSDARAGVGVDADYMDI